MNEKLNLTEVQKEFLAKLSIKAIELEKENAELKRQLQDLNAQYEEYYSNKSERIILALSNENKTLKERLKNLELQINRKIIPTSI